MNFLDSSFVTKLLTESDRPFHKIFLEILDESGYDKNVCIAQTLQYIHDRNDLIMFFCVLIAAGCEISDTVKSEIAEKLIRTSREIRTPMYHVILALVRLNALSKFKESLLKQDEGTCTVKSDISTLCHDNYEFIMALPHDWQMALLEISNAYKQKFFEI